MSVNLSPISGRRFSVGAADDPYKKYWRAILAILIVTGGWLCIPMMETPVGSMRVDTASKPSLDAAGAEQSLDSADNPNGAAGGALDLSMDGAKRKSKGGAYDEMASMLYQAPPPPETGAAAAGKPLSDATAGSASLAQLLKDAGKKTDASGWSEKAQRGFAAPHLAGGSLSGIGSASGGSSPSAGGNVGLFGSRNADVGFAATQGLHGEGTAESAGFRALKASAAAAARPNLHGSDEAMHAGMSQAFDGAKGKAPAANGVGAAGQANAAYALAPANLKANDPKLDSKKLPDPPAAPTPASTSGQNIGQQIAMMAATVLIGGLLPGAGGQMAMMAMMMAQQQMQQKAAADAAAAQAAAAAKQGHG